MPPSVKTTYHNNNGQDNHHQQASTDTRRKSGRICQTSIHNNKRNIINNNNSNNSNLLVPWVASQPQQSSVSHVGKPDTGKIHAPVKTSSDKTEGKRIINSSISRYLKTKNTNKSIRKSIFSVKGRLSKSRTFWKETLKASQFIQNIVEEGYRIPLYIIPEPKCFCNNKSALKEEQFVTDSIKDLLNHNLIVESNTIPHVVSPLSVSINSSGKKRLILDLRYVNSHIWKENIKFDDWKCFSNYLSREKATYLNLT